MRGFMRDDEGATAVIVAITLMVFVALSALVIDMGYWYNVRRQLQTAADSAALAGGHELISDASDAQIWDAVEVYANENSGRPVDGLTVIAPSAGGESDIGADFVKVTVSSDAQSFFGRVLGMNSNLIKAQAVARAGYIAGGKTPVPWALPILRATRVIAVMADGSEKDLDEVTKGHWEADLPLGTRGEVEIVYYNDQTLDPNYPDGVPDEMGPVTRLKSLPAGSRFASVQLQDATVTYGSAGDDEVQVRVELTQELGAGESVTVSTGKSDYTASGSELIYTATFDAPATEDLYDTVDIDVAIESGGKSVEAISGAAVLVLRRSTHPILNVQTSPTVFPAGVTGLTHIEVDLNKYEYGHRYELKVIGGAGETGNFMAIDYSTLRREPYWRSPQDPAQYPDLSSATAEYYEYIAGTSTSEFMVLVHDTVWTEPGNMSGPKTRDALEVRFGTEDADFLAWVDAGKSFSSRRVVYVPITELVQPDTGTSPLHVVNFAVFYVESVATDAGGAAVTGYFVEECQVPPWVVSIDPPGPGMHADTVYLSNQGLDF